MTIDNVAKAIATFERTLLSGNSAYDRYKAGNKSSMTAGQVRGMDVYFNKVKCDRCHEGINFTANAYGNLGIGTDKPERMSAASRSRRILWIGASSKLPRFATSPRLAHICTMGV